MNYEQELDLLLYMIDAASMQLSVVKDHPKARQREKQRLNEYFSVARRFTREVTGLIPAEKQEEHDERNALVLEALKEVIKTRNNIEALALLKSYNRGEVEVRMTV